MLMREEVIFEPPPAKLPVRFAKNGVKLVESTNINKNHAVTYKHKGGGGSDPINHNITRMTEARSKDGACFKYVCSKVTLYYNSRIELKWRRALHHCQSCDYGVGKGNTGVPCGAIHYGMCLPVIDKYSVPRRTWQHKAPSLPAPGSVPVSGGTFWARAEPASSHPASSYTHHSTSPQPSSHTTQGFIQTISNGSSSKDRDTSSTSIHRDTLDNETEKENTNVHALQQKNQFNQTYDALSTSAKESQSRTKKKDNSRPYSSSSVKSVIQNANIPQFYFPMGRPVDRDNSDDILSRVSQEFSKFDGGKVTRQQLGGIAKACGLPFYWKCPLFMCSGGSKQGFVTYPMFASMWKRVFQSCHDRAAQFVMSLAKDGANYLEDEDLVPLIQDVVDTHPGLTFLLEAPEFHSRYVNTVIARIMYCVNRSWTGKITIQEIRKSNLLRIIQILEDEDDINQVTDFFSYEHFYVIYCKFWELDKDHDLFIDKTDLARHNEHAISTRMLDRIFSGAVTRGKTFEEGKMSYPDFVWFLLSEEDKKHPTSVEYWFRCMDIDGDGMISMYEMEYFYEEQMQKMEALGIERLPFEDCLCQMLDLVQPEQKYAIALSDLKRCKMTNIFFDTFMNLDKFLENEQRDPFANLRDLDSDQPEPTDWEKYAAEEYENLVAEEGANDQEEIHYEDDFEPEDEEGNQDLAAMGMGEPRPGDPVSRKGQGHKVNQIEDDIYDFSNSSTY